MNFGSSISVIAAAFRFSEPLVRSVSSANSNTDGPAFQIRMLWSQPPPANKDASSLSDTVCNAPVWSDECKEAAGPTEGLAPS
eukprot:CAMPEP_0115279580 /NCGR_PEP_ID=MMETSP0270-20121206/58335_1 /TAXON_ID=71861 /ORGANISM="Scrippsiella trochoidea, Strain CCMP3099" /LENGTH=82 /DNA_ID=CAMNT_0002696269 /DNA_START=595 /DNA_END=843 /DNA_ORIENTATION=-